PSEMGTLKSTRMKTRLPVKSRSEMDSLCIGDLAAMRTPLLQKQGTMSRFRPLFPSSWRRGGCAHQRFPDPRADGVVPSPALLHDQLNQIAHPATKTPLIVVPGEHLNQAIANGFR